MIKPKFDENQLLFHKFKFAVHATVVEGSWLVSVGEKAYHESLNLKRELNPHQDLMDKLGELKPVVVKILSYSDLLTLRVPLDGSESDKLIAQEMEGKRLSIVQSLQITGFSLSGTGNIAEQNVKIMYKMLDKTNQLVGGATSLIRLKRTTLGDEAEITEILSELQDMIYYYVFNDKSTDQLDLPLFNVPDKVGDAEEEKAAIENE